MFVLFSIIQSVPTFIGPDPQQDLNAMSAVSIILSILLIPIAAGWTWVAMSFARNEEVKVADLFEPYKIFGKVIGVSIVQAVFLFLWTLLLMRPWDRQVVLLLVNVLHPSGWTVNRYSWSDYTLASTHGWTQDGSILALLIVYRLGVTRNCYTWSCCFMGWTILQRYNGKIYDRVRGEQAPEPTSDFVAPY